MTGFSGMAGGGKIGPSLREADSVLKGILTSLREIDRLSTKISRTNINGISSGTRVAGHQSNGGRAAGMADPVFSGASGGNGGGGRTAGGGTSDSQPEQQRQTRMPTPSFGRRVATGAVAVTGVALAGAASSMYERLGSDRTADQLANQISRTGSASWSKAGQRGVDQSLTQASFGGYMDNADRLAGQRIQQLTGQDLGSAMGRRYNAGIAQVAKFTGQTNESSSQFAATFSSAENINKLQMHGIQARDSNGDMSDPRKIMDQVLAMSVGNRKVSSDDIRKGLLPGMGINSSLTNLGMTQEQITDFAKPHMMAKVNPSLAGGAGQSAISAMQNRAGEKGTAEAKTREATLRGMRETDEALGGFSRILSTVIDKMGVFGEVISSVGGGGSTLASTVAGSALTTGAYVAGNALLNRRRGGGRAPSVAPDAASTAARGGGALSKFGKVGGKVLGPVGIGFAGKDIYDDAKDDYFGGRGDDMMVNPEVQGGLNFLKFWKDSHVKRPGMAAGGIVPGNHNRDDVPIFATPGEVVVPTKVVAKHGGANNLMRSLGFTGGGGNGGHYAKGGEVYGGVKSHVGAVGQAVQQMFGVGTIHGKANRSGKSEHPVGLALDFMTSSDSQGDSISSYLLANQEAKAVKYLIWKQRINSGSGWRPMKDRGSRTANHYDHVHVSFNGKAGSGGPDVEGASASTASTGATKSSWRSYADKAIATALGSSRLSAGSLVRGYYGGSGGDDDETPQMGGGSGGDAKVVKGTGTSASNRALGQTLAGRFQWGVGDQWNSLDALFNKESNWNHKAQNPTSTAFGIAQFLNSTWATVGAKKTGDPAGQIDAGLKYIQQRYGDPESAWNFHKKNNYYSKGAWETKTEQANLHQGEMVLPARVAGAVRTELAKGGNGVARGGGGGPVTINVFPAKADMKAAQELAQMVKGILEDDKSMTAIGSF